MVDNDSKTSKPKDPLSDPKAREEFKNNPAAQFKYGRQAQHATEHFDQSSRRLDKGNPDVGEIDLGNIEADKPAEPDDNDHFD
jgi:hypothetical protein